MRTRVLRFADSGSFLPVVAVTFLFYYRLIFLPPPTQLIALRARGHCMYGLPL